MRHVSGLTIEERRAVAACIRIAGGPQDFVNWGDMRVFVTVPNMELYIPYTYTNDLLWYDGTQTAPGWWDEAALEFLER